MTDAEWKAFCQGQNDYQNGDVEHCSYTEQNLITAYLNGFEHEAAKS